MKIVRCGNETIQVSDSFFTEPVVYCPLCEHRVYAEYVDNGFGPYAVQAEPYHCENCGWIETGCPANSCKKCKTWDICQGRSRQGNQPPPKRTNPCKP